MADTEEKVRVLKIDTQSAVKSIAELKEQVSIYKKEMENATIGSDEYKRAQENLISTQNTLQAAQRGCIDTVGSLDKSYNGLVVQMKALKDAQKQVDLSTEAGQKTYADYAKKINDINTQLKNLDSQNGVFSRNVGDYANQFTSAMSAMGVGSNILQKGLMGVKGALDILKAHPIIAVVALVIRLVSKLVDAVKKNENALNSLKKSLAPIQGLLNLFDNLIGKLGNGLAWLVDKIMKLGTAIGNFYKNYYKNIAKLFDAIGLDGLSSTINETIANMEKFGTDAEEIARRQIELQEKHREYVEENAKLEMEASDLRANVADKENRTAEERLQMVKEFGEKQKQIAANNLELAQKELELLELQGAQSENDTEMNNKLADAKAKVYKVQQAYNDTLRTTNKLLSSTTTEIKNEAKAEAKAAEDRRKAMKEAKAFIDTLDDYILTVYQKQIQDVEDSEQAQLDKVKEYLNKGLISRREYNKAVVDIHNATREQLKEIEEQRLQDLEDTNNAYYDLFKSAEEKEIDSVEEKYKKEIDTQKKALDEELINVQEYNERVKRITEEQQREIKKIQTDNKVNDSNTSLENASEVTQETINRLDRERQTKLLYNEWSLEDEKQYQQTRKELLVADYEDAIETHQNNANELLNIDEERYNAEIKAAKDAANAKQEIEYEYDAWLKEERQKQNEEFIAGLDNSLSIMENSLKNIFSIGDGLPTGIADAITTLDTGVINLAKDLKNGEKGWTKYGEMAAAGLNAASQILSSLAEEQDEQTKEGFEKQKKMQIAAATMSMAAGIVAAMVNSIRDLGMPWGAVIGAAESAMVAALGGVQIAQIKKQTLDSGSSANTSTNASLNMANISQAFPQNYDNTVQGASVESALADTRVYVTESDISDTQTRVRVSESENRF